MKAMAMALVLCAALIWCPATWLDLVLTRATQGQLRLAEASGTLWRGSGQLTRLAAQGATEPLGRAQWVFQPMSLTWRATMGDASATLAWSGTSWRVEGLDAGWPEELARAWSATEN